MNERLELVERMTGVGRKNDWSYSISQLQLFD